MTKSIPRFFVNPEAISGAQRCIRIVDREQVAQISRVLRSKVNDKITCLDGKGLLFDCLIENITPKQVLLKIVAEERALGDPLIKICLAMPLLKGGRFEWALEKACEIGVSRVVPLALERSVVKISDKVLDKEANASGKIQRWQKVLREASEQCERATIPEIDHPASLIDVLSGTFSEKPYRADVALLCAERQDVVALTELVYGWKIEEVVPRDILLIVGPEGGFTEIEFAQARDHLAKLVSLGPRILRSETAAICALNQIISLVGDLVGDQN